MEGMLRRQIGLSTNITLEEKRMKRRESMLSPKYFTSSK
jgi:hypothetical protein